MWYLSDNKLSLSEQGVFGFLWEEGVRMEGDFGEVKV